MQTDVVNRDRRAIARIPLCKKEVRDLFDKDGMACLDEAKEFYERDGFVVLQGFFSPSRVADFSLWCDDLVAQHTAHHGLMTYMEDDRIHPGRRIISRIEHFVDFHAGFHSLACDLGLLQVISKLIDDRPVLFKDKVNFKLPGSGGFEPHQDIQPGWDTYAPYFVSVLIAVDESTQSNGCLELAPGHHRRGMIGRRWEPLQDEELEGIEFHACPMAAGDIAIFDCFVPHCSKPNNCEVPRRNLYLTYNRHADGDHRTQYFTDKRRSFPPDREREFDKKYIFRV